MGKNCIALFWSEILYIVSHIATDTASKCILFTIWRVVYLQRTVFTHAFRQLVFSFPRNIISCALFLMAFFTKMSVTPTEPLGNWAAELAFKLNEFFLMLWTALNSPTNSHGRALTADQFFFFEVLIIVVCILTILHTSEIGLTAFETLIIR